MPHQISEFCLIKINSPDVHAVGHQIFADLLKPGTVHPENFQQLTYIMIASKSFPVLNNAAAESRTDSPYPNEFQAVGGIDVDDKRFGRWTNSADIPLR
ncbi:MAG: hypothetical protein EA394_07290 [Bacteroidia bacterium]|nr:MAG: hypothetical protein EA394_07290 [Bacteroidia bacterium]